MSLQKIATITASLISFWLAILKILVWIFTNSIAIISSAVDSFLDMFISLFNFFAVSNSSKNPDQKYNYWRWKIEALASFLEWVIVILSWLFIFYESVKKIILKEQVTETIVWIYVMIFSVFITACLVFFLNYVWNKTNNLVVKSDSLHYKTDLFSNVAILSWLFAIYFFQFYLIDAILWIIISIYIIFSAIKIIKEWYELLLDVSLDYEEVEQIKEIIKNFEKIENFHELKTRKSAEVKFIEAHLVFERNISLAEAHNISHEIEDEIKKIDEKSRWLTTFHLDSYNDEEEDLKKKLN